MAKGNLKIHTENILPIIKKWLYSDKEIFVRELVSNACDALHKLKTLKERGEAAYDESALRIDIQIDKDTRTLKFSDTGIGMTGEEVEKYIAQIAFSGAEDFVKQYQTPNEKDQIIGHFGLGFYSAYMVSSLVTIDTLSYKENAASCFWSCDGSTEYTLESSAKTTRGSDITLHLDAESDEFLEESRIREILMRYCAYLPYPIYLNGSHINARQPLWLKAPSECTEQEYLEFYHELYPMEPDPIYWVHLNVDYPFNLKGILYFPKVTRGFDWNKSSIKLFCNRIFVSDNCKELIPDYLMVLRGAIDSPDIPLNVSRSYLQMDRTVRQLSTHVAKKVADRLSSTYLNEREKFLESWPDVEWIVKLGILQDEKFYERAKEFLIWKNLLGEWTTIEDYLERRRESYNNKIFYTVDENHHPQFLDLYKQKEIEVLIASSPMDTTVMTHLERKLTPARFQRVDGAIDPSILDSSRENNLLDADGRSESAKLADFIRSKLGLDKVAVEAKSLASDNIPAFVVVDEETRRLREYFALSNQSMPFDLAGKRTFVVNTNNKLIQKLQEVGNKDPQLAEDVVRHLYELSLLSQKELDPASMSGFVTRSAQVLEKLATL